MLCPVQTRRAMDVAELLNLKKSLDNLVGSRCVRAWPARGRQNLACLCRACLSACSMIKGISGGEKRRLSLGMEMITSPAILFLDEPTSGLDAFTAYKVGGPASTPLQCLPRLHPPACTGGAHPVFHCTQLWPHGKQQAQAGSEQPSGWATLCLPVCMFRLWLPFTSPPQKCSTSLMT
jgi:hypothetical protein